MSHPKSRREHLRIAGTDDGGLAIYDEISDDGHILNIIAAAVYELADGTRSIDTIAEQVATRTGAPVNQELVWQAMDELDHAGLLEGNDTVPAPGSKGGIFGQPRARRWGRRARSPNRFDHQSEPGGGQLFFVITIECHPTRDDSVTAWGWRLSAPARNATPRPGGGAYLPPARQRDAAKA